MIKFFKNRLEKTHMKRNLIMKDSRSHYDVAEALQLTEAEKEELKLLWNP